MEVDMLEKAAAYDLSAADKLLKLLVSDGKKGRLFLMEVPRALECLEVRPD